MNTTHFAIVRNDTQEIIGLGHSESSAWNGAELNTNSLNRMLHDVVQFDMMRSHLVTYSDGRVFFESSY